MKRLLQALASLAPVLPVLLVLLVLLSADPARASVPDAGTGAAAASKLAPAVLSGASSVPRLWLAQRSIEREWGPSEDSTYKTVDVPGWKSEGLALAISGALPGAGQLYVGENSGWLYLLGEAAGWIGRTITRHRGNELRNDAAAFVGDPTDPSATWSFERYATRSGGEATALEDLWGVDREAFYQALATDPRYRPGFAGANPQATFDSYRGLRDASQSRFRQSRYFEIALLMNHAVAGFDALRTARIHNLPLRRNLDLQLGGRWRRGEPQLRAALVGRF